MYTILYLICIVSRVYLWFLISSVPTYIPTIFFQISYPIFSFNTLEFILQHRFNRCFKISIFKLHRIHLRFYSSNQERFLSYTLSASYPRN